MSSLRYFGHKPFYVGQFMRDVSKEQFLRNDCFVYDGSGKTWERFCKGLKRKFPTCWRKLIKREVLFYSENCSQKVLDKMEEYFIKHEKAHYSYKLGGTNIAWGGNGSKTDESTKIKLREINLGKKLSDVTKKKMSESRKGIKIKDSAKKKMSLSKIGDKNPMKNKEVREKVSKSNLGKISWNRGKKTSEETRNKMSSSHIGKTPWNKGIKMSEEFKNNLSDKLKGRKLSDEHRNAIQKYVSENHPFKGKHHTEETKKRLSEHFMGITPGNKGKVCINNGHNNKYINSFDKIPFGWEYGKYK